MADTDDLLKALQAHGQAFLSSFDLPKSSSSKRSKKRKREDEPGTGKKEKKGLSEGFVGKRVKRKRMEVDEDEAVSDEEGYANDGWGGIRSGAVDSGSDEEAEEGMEESTTTRQKVPEVVVFSQSTSTSSSKLPSNKTLSKAFMVSLTFNELIFCVLLLRPRTFSLPKYPRYAHLNPTIQ